MVSRSTDVENGLSGLWTISPSILYEMPSTDERSPCSSRVLARAFNVKSYSHRATISIAACPRIEAAYWDAGGPTRTVVTAGYASFMAFATLMSLFRLGKLESMTRRSGSNLPISSMTSSFAQFHAGASTSRVSCSCSRSAVA